MENALPSYTSNNLFTLMYCFVYQGNHLLKLFIHIMYDYQYYVNTAVLATLLCILCTHIKVHISIAI